MFKKLKELFKLPPKVDDFDWSAGSYHVTPAIPVLSEHQRMRRELFSGACKDGGIKTAETYLEAFDKAFPLAPDREQAVQEMLLLDVYPFGEERGGVMSRKAFCEAMHDAGYRKQ